MSYTIITKKEKEIKRRKNNYKMTITMKWKIPEFLIKEKIRNTRMRSWEL